MKIQRQKPCINPEPVPDNWQQDILKSLIESNRLLAQSSVLLAANARVLTEMIIAESRTEINSGSIHINTNANQIRGTYGRPSNN